MQHFYKMHVNFHYQEVPENIFSSTKYYKSSHLHIFLCLGLPRLKVKKKILRLIFQEDSKQACEIISRVVWNFHYFQHLNSFSLLRTSSLEALFNHKCSCYLWYPLNLWHTMTSETSLHKACAPGNDAKHADGDLEGLWWNVRKVSEDSKWRPEATEARRDFGFFWPYKFELPHQMVSCEHWTTKMRSTFWRIGSKKMDPFPDKYFKSKQLCGNPEMDPGCTQSLARWPLETGTSTPGDKHVW